MITALSTIFVLGVLVFFHELGHFLAAKRAGIRVEKFSLGFPPTILKKKFGDTEYCLGAIPLGGFVKMAGENPDESVTGASYEFASKSIGARAVVIFAGPFANFMLAWVIIWGLLFFQGEVVTDSERAVIGMIAPDSPAEGVGIQEKDVITSINGTPVSSFVQMADLIKVEVEKPLTIVWERDGLEMSATLTTMAVEVRDLQNEMTMVGRIGVAESGEYVPLGFFNAAGRGFTRSLEFVKMVGIFVYDFVTMKISPKMIGGPVFITQMAGETARLGFSSLLVFMALLSVNLAVLNVLPIPILDGGHLIFLLVEKIKGSPLSINQRMIAQQVGMVFLILTLVLVTYNDIMRFISG